MGKLLVCQNISIFVKEIKENRYNKKAQYEHISTCKSTESSFFFQGEDQLPDFTGYQKEKNVRTHKQDIRFTFPTPNHFLVVCHILTRITFSTHNIPKHLPIDTDNLRYKWQW